eukprot:TRINITY_DN1388_c1_g1_i2.p2 TRINITY_DN1388_c1_g1~~TRINITY_DN1388_c1_g1_i2.p2  ORF type:complete len:827 (-),score=186.10 TRINITY_DN1388_c1_g1_i2:715-3195(-)
MKDREIEYKATQVKGDKKGSRPRVRRPDFALNPQSNFKRADGVEGLSDIEIEFIPDGNLPIEGQSYADDETEELVLGMPPRHPKPVHQSRSETNIQSPAPETDSDLSSNRKANRRQSGLKPSRNTNIHPTMHDFDDRDSQYVDGESAMQNLGSSANVHSTGLDGPNTSSKARVKTKAKAKHSMKPKPNMNFETGDIETPTSSAFDQEEEPPFAKAARPALRGPRAPKPRVLVDAESKQTPKAHTSQRLALTDERSQASPSNASDAQSTFKSSRASNTPNSSRAVAGIHAASEHNPESTVLPALRPSSAGMASRNLSAENTLPSANLDIPTRLESVSTSRSFQNRDPAVSQSRESSSNDTPPKEHVQSNVAHSVGKSSLSNPAIPSSHHTLATNAHQGSTHTHPPFHPHGSRGAEGAADHMIAKRSAGPPSASRPLPSITPIANGPQGRARFIASKQDKNASSDTETQNTDHPRHQFVRQSVEGRLRPVSQTENTQPTTDDAESDVEIEVEVQEEIEEDIPDHTEQANELHLATHDPKDAHGMEHVSSMDGLARVGALTQPIYDSGFDSDADPFEADRSAGALMGFRLLPAPPKRPAMIQRLPSPIPPSPSASPPLQRTATANTHTTTATHNRSNTQPQPIANALTSRPTSNTSTVRIASGRETSEQIRRDRGLHIDPDLIIPTPSHQTGPNLLHSPPPYQTRLHLASQSSRLSSATASRGRIDAHTRTHLDGLQQTRSAPTSANSAKRITQVEYDLLSQPIMQGDDANSNPSSAPLEQSRNQEANRDSNHGANAGAHGRVAKAVTFGNPQSDAIVPQEMQSDEHGY